METVLNCNLCRSSQIQVVDHDWNFCRCGECGYVFDSPRPTIQELVAFYSRPGKYDSWLAVEQARDRLWQRRLKKFLPQRSPGNLLDVGTGIGQFLHHAQPFFTEVHGTEVSESAVKVAKEKYGLQVTLGQVEELDLPRSSFDNVTLFHVLEHVPDPVRLIERCRSLLRANGSLVIAVPNDVLAWTSVLKKVGKRLGLRGFDKFSPVLGISRAGTSREIHLSHFTPTVLRALLKKSGFEIVQDSIDPYYVSSGFRALLDLLYYAFHSAFLTVTGVNRYDTIWMIARKRPTASVGEGANS